MLTSLLSLYIFSVVNLNISTDIPAALEETNSIIKLASLDLSSLIEAKSTPVKKYAFIAPIINAKSGIAIDLKTGGVLFAKNAHDRLSIASITKLMTAMLIMEESNFDEIAKISANAASVGGSRMDLKAGEEISVENLMYGVVIQSANDAASALAEHNAGTVEKFVQKMNQKALQFGLVNTHYSNPIGLDGKDNYSSAYDLAKLGKYIYQKQFIKEAALITEKEVTSVSKDLTHKLKSTNELLGRNELGIHFKGLKTGKTEEAGLCLVSIAEDENGHEILTVLLNSPDRFKETKILADWVFRAYNWQD